MRISSALVCEHLPSSRHSAGNARQCSQSICGTPTWDGAHCVPIWQENKGRLRQVATCSKSFCRAGFSVWVCLISKGCAVTHCTIWCIHLFSRHSLSTYKVPGLGLGAVNQQWTNRQGFSVHCNSGKWAFLKCSSQDRKGYAAVTNNTSISILNTSLFLAQAAHPPWVTRGPLLITGEQTDGGVTSQTLLVTTPGRKGVL